MEHETGPDRPPTAAEIRFQEAARRGDLREMQRILNEAADAVPVLLVDPEGRLRRC